MSDTVQFAAAWNDYVCRRRWFFGVWLGGFFVVILLTGLFAPLLGDLAFYIFGPSWLLSFAIAGLRLSFFRCPRCHHHFFCTWLHNNPFRRSCIHCGLPKWSEKDLN
jgi:antibiotic biosynthesis monooxygenase (ABM) superfamily enzyme